MNIFIKTCDIVSILFLRQLQLRICWFAWSREVRKVRKVRKVWKVRSRHSEHVGLLLRWKARINTDPWWSGFSGCILLRGSEKSLSRLCCWLLIYANVISVSLLVLEKCESRGVDYNVVHFLLCSSSSYWGTRTLFQQKKFFNLLTLVKGRFLFRWDFFLYLSFNHSINLTVPSIARRKIWIQLL